MTTDTVSSRRSILKGGALLAAPLAVVSTTAAVAEEAHKSRLAQLEDQTAIRDLHQAWLRKVNTGAREDAGLPFADPRRAAFDKTVSSIAPDHAGEVDAIEIASDGKSAAGRFSCTVEVATELPKDSTLAQMAHAQGGGTVRHSERRLLKAAYVKVDGAWAIAGIELLPSPTGRGRGPTAMRAGG